MAAQRRPLDHSAYDQSTIDWQRLHAYAQRVTRGTKAPLVGPLAYLSGSGRGETVLGSHWVLEHRHWHRRDTSTVLGTLVEDTIHEDHTWALLPDGTLVKAVTTHNEVLNYGGPRSGLVVDQKSHSVRPVTESDVIVFDFAKEWNDSSSRPRNGIITWGDAAPGRKLIRHAKGVGMNLALKRLIEVQPGAR